MVSKDEDYNHLENDTTQLQQWKGTFGRDYIKRNIYNEWMLDKGTDAFGKMLKGINYESALEVGSSIGMNLKFLTSITNDDVKLYAIEPNEEAYSKLCDDDSIRLKQAWNCSAYQIPLPDASIDLVFTKGVLIHISPKDLKKATDEIIRVAKRFILCVEYFSHTPEMVEYRGKSNLLFKRDFGSYYLDNYHNLSCIAYGFLWQRDYKIFDNLNWWLFQKK